MKSSTLFLTAAAFVLWGMSGCSSTTETADTAATTEPVTAPAVTPQPVATDTSGTGNLSDDPTNFVLLAGSLDLLETQSSNQALAVVKNPDVRNFAQEVLSEHRKISQELRDMANLKQLKYPTGLLPKHQLMLNRLTEEKPKDFDKTYMELQEAAHKELEELFEDASKRHSDPDMKEYATRNLPTMRTYLETSRKVKDIVD